MRRSEVILALISLVIAAFVTLGVYHALTSSPSPEVTKEACKLKATYKNIAVAKQLIHLGEYIRVEKLEYTKWPEEALHPDFFQESDVNKDTFKEYVAKRTIAPGEPISKSNIINAKDQGALAALLKPGMRAVSINVEASSVSSGLIVPGDIVDVIVTYIPSDANKQKVTSKVILCSIRILALDQRIHNTASLPPGQKAEGSHQHDIPRTATLELTNEQAESLLSAAKIGTISLSLRPTPSTKEVVETCQPGIIIPEKEPIKEPEPEKVVTKEPEKPKEEDDKVTIIRGTPSSAPGAKS
ncbi:MAG TPA: Flp pilus assembly protein CpaB [Candidatus Nitrosotenuis sp.]|jgi:pilus assembly protein CpaB|nr:Flp pilus assembly protein CpaB [Candidatus Nitrosotenuis sp.]